MEIVPLATGPEFPLKSAYPFASNFGLNNDVEKIKSMNVEWEVRETRVKRGRMIEVLKNNNLFEIFLKEVWPRGLKSEGHKKIKECIESWNIYRKGDWKKYQNKRNKKPINFYTKEILEDIHSLSFSFTDWIIWNKRNTQEIIDLPGVYLLAHFKTKPECAVNLSSENIIYVGETCTQNFKKRWNQFNNSAFKAKDGHSGGHTYRKNFADSGENLYVSALPVERLKESIKPYYIRYIERKIIWEYILKWNKAPLCNNK